MTPAQRAVAAFNLEEPDIVPTFELEFQLSDELLGRPLVSSNQLQNLSPAERERKLWENAETLARIAEELDYAIINVYGLNEDDAAFTLRALRKLVGDHRLLGINFGGTYAIPSGSNMCEFVYFLHDRSEEAHERAQAMVNDAVRRARKFREAGADVFFECADYAFRSGPFMSPQMFAEFVTPYLCQLVEAVREELGAYFVKHTDGDIMPILDQLVSCKPHAIHSIDPMAGMNLAEVKRLVGDKVALCGNVNCAILQTGTPEDVVQDTLRAIREGMSGGGFFLTTSNCVFRGMPLENYLTMLETLRHYGRYPSSS